MRMRRLLHLACAALGLASCATAGPQRRLRGVRLEQLTWTEAEHLLTPDTVVVLPIGAAAKEHGPHLQLRNDALLAEYFTGALLAREEVIALPPLAYHYYPAFVEYPGSVSLRRETARDLVVDIVRDIARFGPRRFYVLNTGISTIGPLRDAQSLLAAEGILLAFTDLEQALAPVRSLVTQPRGSHADEVETSMMLVIAPETVELRRAVSDCNEDRPGPLTRRRDGEGTYSPTGTWGDPTRATADKGRRFIGAIVRRIVADVQALRTAPLPATSGSTTPPNG